MQIYYDNTGEVAVSDPSESIVWQDVSSTLQNAVGKTRVLLLLLPHFLPI